MAGILNLLSSINGVFIIVKDAYFNLVSILLNTTTINGAQNNTFLDSSTANAGSGFPVTRSGNVAQGTFTPYSQTGWSSNFNGSTDYLTVTDTTNLRFGSANFTIEAWIYRAASGVIQTIASKGASTPTGWVFQISAANKLVFTDTSTSITGATSLVVNTWYYVAVVRAGTGASQTTLYLNAVSDATGTSATNFNQTNNMLVGVDRSSLNFFNGYISNLRLSNTNRTISSTPTTALTADANTIFLALNSYWFSYTDSTLSYITTVANGTPSIQSFSPFVPTSAYSTSLIGGSGYFDGSSNLTVANNAAFNFGTGDFTVEFWFYALAPAADARFISNALYSSSGIDISWGSGSNVIYWYISSTPYSVPLPNRYAWNHVAFARTGTTFNTYINGNRANSYSGISANITSANLLAIGCSYTGSNLTNAYISNMRLLKGTALYTGATYTIPTAPLTNITNTSLLLNFVNENIYDATAKNTIDTAGTAQVSTTQAKYGSTSMSFGNSGNGYLVFRQPINNYISFGTGDFTFECWVYLNSLTGNPMLYDTIAFADGTGTGRFAVYVAVTTGVVTLITGTGTIITSGGALTINTWYYLAITRQAGSTKIFVNGTQVNTTASDATNYVCGTPNRPVVGINAFDVASQPLNGYIDELRITKGFARTVTSIPTAAFPVQ
jgi:hypothetical protein